MKLKKGDAVLVISGKDRGKHGSIEKVIPKENKIVITGVNLAKHHLKPSRKNPHGGIMDKLAPLDASNAILVCPHCSRATRIGYKVITENNRRKKIRICKKCQESCELK